MSSSPLLTRPLKTGLAWWMVCPYLNKRGVDILPRCWCRCRLRNKLIESRQMHYLIPLLLCSLWSPLQSPFLDMHREKSMNDFITNKFSACVGDVDMIVSWKDYRVHVWIKLKLTDVSCLMILHEHSQTHVNSTHSRASTQTDKPIEPSWHGHGQGDSGVGIYIIICN